MIYFLLSATWKHHYCSDLKGIATNVLQNWLETPETLLKGPWLCNYFDAICSSQTYSDFTGPWPPPKKKSYLLNFSDSLRWFLGLAKGFRSPTNFWITHFFPAESHFGKKKQVKIDHIFTPMKQRFCLCFQVFSWEILVTQIWRRWCSPIFWCAPSFSVSQSRPITFTSWQFLRWSIEDTEGLQFTLENFQS